MLPIVQSVTHVYQEHANTGIILQGGGSSVGIASVRDKKADIGMVGRNLTLEEMEEFGHAAIGHDALAVIINSHNPRQGISRGELRDIYIGRTATWSTGNEDHAGIVLISKRVGRGTLEVFEAYTGLLSPFRAQMPANGQETISTSAWEAGANLDSILWVGGIREAIGFVSIGDAQRFIRMGMPIRVLEVDSSLPTPELVVEGGYPLGRGLHLVYLRGNPQAEAFVRFMLSEPGQAAVVEQGFIPAFPPGGLQEVRP